MEFDENCRRRVIRELQRNFGVDLSKIGHSRKYLIDDRCVRYVVLGGVDFRHEIPHSIFQEEEQVPGDTLLVVATLDRRSLDIFVGRFRPLLEHRDQLSISNDHYIVHLHRFGSRLIVREIPSLELEQIRPQMPADRRSTGKTILENLRRAKAIATARDKLPKSKGDASSLTDHRVVSVEGNLIRADFRRKDTK